MAIRNRAALGFERLETRDTPSVGVVGYLGGGRSAVYLQQTTTGGDQEVITYRLVPPNPIVPGVVAYPVDPIVPGLFRAVQGGGGGSVDA